MKWVVTGDSDRMDGLLYVVEAGSREEAIRKVGELIGEKVTFDHEFLDDKGDFIGCSLPEPDSDQIKWCWRVWAQELKLNTGLDACW